MTLSTSPSRARLATLLVVPLLVLSGCGGGSDDDTGDTGDSGGTGDRAGSGDVPALQGEDCDAEVSLTGAVSAEWDGEATVDVSESDVAPPATYQSNHDGYMLTVSAVGNGFDDPTVTLLTGDGGAYAVAFGEGSVEVADDGSGATVDAPAGDAGGSDGSVQVRATFDC